MQPIDALDGALLIDKPAGMTSHDVVDEVRRYFHIKKVGHCGTLDPGATGLLILVVGRTTKLSERLMGMDKVYEGKIKLGETTSSYDADGELVGSLPVPPFTLEEIAAQAAEHQGDQMQVPPMVSALKVNGVPLYKMARKGIEIERKPRLIRVYYFKIISYVEPVITFRVACTKGTYVRTLAHDLGQKLGCGAHLQSLRRISSGKFEVQNAIELNKLVTLSPAEFQTRLIPQLTLAQSLEPI